MWATPTIRRLVATVRITPSVAMKHPSVTPCHPRPMIVAPPLSSLAHRTCRSISRMTVERTHLELETEMPTCRNAAFLIFPTRARVHSCASQMLPAHAAKRLRLRSRQQHAHHPQRRHLAPFRIRNSHRHLAIRTLAPPQ